MKTSDDIGELMPLGEAVMGKYPKTKDMSKSRFEMGKRSVCWQDHQLRGAHTHDRGRFADLPNSEKIAERIAVPERSARWSQRSAMEVVPGLLKSRPEAIGDESIRQCWKMKSEKKKRLNLRRKKVCQQHLWFKLLNYRDQAHRQLAKEWKKL